MRGRSQLRHGGFSIRRRRFRGRRGLSQFFFFGNNLTNCGSFSTSSLVGVASITPVHEKREQRRKSTKEVPKAIKHVFSAEKKRNSMSFKCYACRSTTRTTRWRESLSSTSTVWIVRCNVSIRDRKEAQDDYLDCFATPEQFFWIPCCRVIISIGISFFVTYNTGRSRPTSRCSKTMAWFVVPFKSSSVNLAVLLG